MEHKPLMGPGAEKRGRGSSMPGARRAVVVAGSASIAVDIVLASLANALNQADRQIMPIAAIPMKKELGWTQMQVGWVLSSFAYGYILSQLPSGWVSARLPPFGLLFAAVSCWSAATMLTASAARQDLPTLIACRVAMGVAEGFCLPAIFQLFANRVPVRLRSRAFSVMLGFGAIGQLLGLLVCPLMLTPWERLFELFGGAGFVWCAGCLLCVLARTCCCCCCRGGDNLRVTAQIGGEEEDGAEDNGAQAAAKPAGPGAAHARHTPSASESDSRSDSSSTLSADEEAASEAADTQRLEPRDAPLALRLLRCRPLLAIVCAHFGQNWTNYTLSNWLPTYLSEVLGMPTRSLAFTSLPFLANALAGMAVGHAADALIARRVCSVLTVRRLATLTGLLGPAGCLVLFTLTSSPPVAIAVISLSFTLGAATSSGFMANHSDISESYAGLTFGIANTFATIPGILAGPLTAWMVQQSGGAWSPVFFTAAAINVACALVYLLFSKAHRVL